MKTEDEAQIKGAKHPRIKAKPDTRAGEGSGEEAW